MKIEIYKTSAGFTVLINEYRVCGIKILPGNECLYSSPISEDALVRAQQNNKVNLQTDNQQLKAAISQVRAACVSKNKISTRRFGFINRVLMLLEKHEAV